MSGSGTHSERAIIFASTGRDGPVAAAILNEGGFSADICVDLPGVCEKLAEGAGLAIIADEAIRHADLRPLVAFLARQPPWSDFPVILLTQRGGGPERNPAAARLADILGNVIFLERPFHPMTLVSMVRNAVRGRRRQYQARALLHELGESEQQLQTALKAGQLGSWTLDVRDMQLRVSESCRAHFGRDGAEAFGYDEFRDATQVDDRARVQAVLDRALRSGDGYGIEYRIVWPDASLHWIDVRARALTNAAGAVTRLVGVSSDITARKTSELERERLLAELAAERAALSELTATLEQRVQERTVELMVEVAARERAQEQLLQAQKMESIGQLTGGVAHDFNNLLTAIIGNLELLGRRVPGDAPAQRLIEGAIQGAQRGASLTQRMLAFARQQDLKATSADIGTLLAGMRDLFERVLGPRIRLVLDRPERLPAAHVDANQIELAILNLAINARDAMPDGGTITIAVSHEAAPAGEELAHDSYLRLRISDTGTGMDEATLKRAIEPFFSTKPPGKGTGLGLSMVHGLAVQLGGRLELESEPGVGTTATLWLPVATESQVAEKKSDARIAPSRTATILVVDDDPLVATSTVCLLEDLGHCVIGANSGRDALEILDTRKVDLLLTDQAMPDMTGMELAEIVHRRSPAMPILLVTGYADLPAGHKTNLPRLSKPYRQAQLQAEVDRLLKSA